MSAKQTLLDRGEKALTSTEPTTIVFGTSGWRDKIGEGFTLLNVHKCVRGIIEMMKTPEFFKQNGYTSFEEGQKAGILILRDNRYLGDTFIEAAAQELAAQEIKTYIAGECPTGVGSAVLTELKAAGSINFTPSHNPMDYAGLKFNPADGGPAGTEITTLIEKFANGYMNRTFELPQPPLEKRGQGEFVNAKQIYKTFLERSPLFNLKEICTWLRNNKANTKIIVDNFYGSSRGYIEALLGDNLVQELKSAQALDFWHIEDDITFGGKKPEPSAENQKPIMEALKKSGRKILLGVFTDPDADRIRFCDDKLDVSMNLFGPIAYAGLIDHGFKGGITSTVPSSALGFEIARQNNQPSFETPVGFKFFRPYLSTNKTLVAFEESDGISFAHHTLEKDAVGGFVCALSCMMWTGKNLSVQYSNIQKKYGFYYPDRAGLDIKGVSPAEWDAYKKKLLPVLTGNLFKTGDSVPVGSQNKKIASINTMDGLKLIFDDKSWLLLRASGTEPKFRIYSEVVSKTPLGDVDVQIKNYRDAGEWILERVKKECEA